MNIRYKKLMIIPVLFLVFSCTAPGGNENTIITMSTTHGNIKIRLYDETQIHRDNFIKLTKSGFFDGISFHRVIQDFMIQAGDASTKNVSESPVPDSINTYTIPAEFNTIYFHKKGALAAARMGNDVNPEMRSSGTQFYLVQGIKYNDSDLNMSEQRINGNIKQAAYSNFIKEISDSLQQEGNFASDGEIQELASMKMFDYLTTYEDYKISAEQRTIYKTIGGVPRLDGTYTVFGEVIDGLDVIDKIAAVPTDTSDKPLDDIKIIKMTVDKK